MNIYSYRIEGKFIICVVMFALISLTSQNTFADEKTHLTVDKQLQIFIPYLGTWQSDFKVEEGKSPVTDVSKWERALNGKAIRTLHSINQGEYGGESLIFFDKAKNSIVFYYFTTAGFYTSGTIELLSGYRFAAYESVTGNDNGISQVKSVSELHEGKLRVSTSYLKNGKWTEPEQRDYFPSKQDVVFK